MSFFYLLPAYWLTGMLLYASSPRQQFLKTKQFKPPRWLALVTIALLSVITLSLLVSAHFSPVVAGIFALLGLMLFIPAPVFLLNHKPQWAIASIIAICMLSAGLQLISGGQ
ncbi:hypothetical protein CWB72_13575 [Pseudoalteromonas phenolica]|uniref:hypothetical protein n=1 Tax=Pseudoalteromonas phenolica TaxID=161398 RepID=UPI00110B6D41|nr:hypothetical protein [Pseudoalteromonas phenolica]TMN88145.1 hypothetical protein CWB72_13575 [Pseudoalteromonas phenolica]